MSNPNPVVDVHRHFFPAALPSGYARLGRTLLQILATLTESAAYSTVTVKGVTSPLYADGRNLDRQLEVQRAAGVTRGVLSFSTLVELLSTAAHLSPTKVARLVNDALAGAVKAHPLEFDFLATVNPFDPDAPEELERCFRTLGAKGVSVPSSWDGKYLDGPELDGFWDAVEKFHTAVLLHPPMVPIGYRQMDAFRLAEGVGRPFDLTLSVSRLILSGLFDRYRSLQLVLPAMGGALPSVIGRLQFGYRLGYDGLPEGQAAVCKRPPAEYVRSNLYVDTVGFSPLGIRHCLELFGPDRVLFGSDYPVIPISPAEHLAMIRELRLSAEDEERVLWRNATELFLPKV
jgi:predicted TIM-barrel fold metal-dependent hydrolase